MIYFQCRKLQLHCIRIQPEILEAASDKSFSMLKIELENTERENSFLMTETGKHVSQNRIRKHRTKIAANVCHLTAVKAFPST